MRKRVAVMRMILIQAVFLLLLVGCAGNTQHTGGDPPESQCPPESQDQATEEVRLTSEIFGFYLTAPASWREKVDVSEDENGFIVTHRTKSSEATVQNPVLINIIDYGTVEEWERDSKKEDEPFPYEKVGEANGRVFASISLFDFPYDPGCSEDAKEYEELLSSLAEVLRSFTTVYKAGASSEASTGDNRYAVAGIDDPAAFEAYFHEIKALIAQDDRRQVVKHFSYPVELNIGGEKVTIKDETEMLGSYDDLFNEKVLGAMKEQKVEDLFVNAMGVMVGDGQLWFGVTMQGEYFILSVNP